MRPFWTRRKLDRDGAYREERRWLRVEIGLWASLAALIALLVLKQMNIL